MLFRVGVNYGLCSGLMSSIVLLYTYNVLFNNQTLFNQQNYNTTSCAFSQTTSLSAALTTKHRNNKQFHFAVTVP